MSNASYEARAMDLFEQSGVIIPGHFVGTKWGHLDAYVRKDMTISDPVLLGEVTDLMASQIAESFEPGEIDVIVGIAPCSSQLATGVSSRLPGKPGANQTTWEAMLPVAFAEKHPTAYLDAAGEPAVETNLVFKRGFDVSLIGKRVLLIEDVLNTGGSLVELRELAEGIEGLTVVGAAAEFNRKPQQNTAEFFGVPKLLSLISREMPNHPEDDCPMCRKGIPVNTDYGHGAKFLAKQKS